MSGLFTALYKRNITFKIYHYGKIFFFFCIVCLLLPLAVRVRNILIAVQQYACGTIFRN